MTLAHNAPLALTMNLHQYFFTSKSFIYVLQYIIIILLIIIILNYVKNYVSTIQFDLIQFDLDKISIRFDSDVKKEIIFNLIRHKKTLNSHLKEIHIYYGSR